MKLIQICFPVYKMMFMYFLCTHSVRIHLKICLVSQSQIYNIILVIVNMLNIRTQLCYIFQIFKFCFFSLTYSFTPATNILLFAYVNVRLQFRVYHEFFLPQCLVFYSCIIVLYNTKFSLHDLLKFSSFPGSILKVIREHSDSEQSICRGFSSNFQLHRYFSHYSTFKNFFVIDSTLMFPKNSVHASNSIESNLVPHRVFIIYICAWEAVARFYNLQLCQGKGMRPWQVSVVRTFPRKM